MRNDCPACGYPADEDARQPASECPCCGFASETADESSPSPAEWRRHWIECGMPWTSMAVPQPRQWDPAKQLRNRPEHEEGQA